MNFENLNFNNLPLIGYGKYGHVYLVEFAGKKYALKVLNFQNNHLLSYSNFVREISVLSKYHYPTILSIYGYDQTHNYMILTEYMEKGSLESFFSNQDKYRELDDDKRFIIGYGVALGMKYLHDHNVSHRDLKPENILVNDKYFPIICDFGFSTESTLEVKATSILGTPLFCAPEIGLTNFSSSNIESVTSSEPSQNLSSLNSSSYDAKKADVFSFGVVLLCLFLESYDDLFSFLSENKKFKIYLLLEKISNETIKNLIEVCCDEDPNNRPDFESIVKTMRMMFQIGFETKQTYQEFNKFIEEDHMEIPNINMNFQELLYECSDIGLHLYQDESFNRNRILSKEYLKIAAGLGSLDAKICLDVLQENLDENETIKIIENYEKLEQSHLNSYLLHTIGYLFHHGVGVKRNYEKALEYYERSAELGNSYALNNLGRLYENGYGVEVDYKKAMEYYEKSAEKGNSYAFNNIGYLYENGFGVEVDYKKAKEYYEKSAELGNSYALNNLDGCGVTESSKRSIDINS